jgi:hypothetical protein
MRKTWLGFGLVLLLPFSARAWNATGHEAVAGIAWDNMTPAAQQQAIAILTASQAGDCLHELDAGDPRAFFIRAATWPDVVRPERKKDAQGNPIPDTRPCTQFNEPGEHFQDHFWSGTSGGTGANAPKDRPDVPMRPKNAVERLTAFRPLVACTASPCTATVEQAHELAWILHLAGDVHQPLHNASRVTTAPKEDQGDTGGNSFLLQAGPNLPPNLHSFWDNIVDNTIPRNQGETDAAYVDRVIKRIQGDHPKATLAARIESGQFDAWSEEGFKTAERVAYPASLKRDGMPSKTYRDTAFKVADEAIALAGYRLADLLDKTLAP